MTARTPADDAGERHYPTTPVQCACGWRQTDPNAGSWQDHMAAEARTEVDRLRETVTSLRHDTVVDHACEVYELSPAECFAAEACSHCGVRRDEHDGEVVSSPMPELHIMDHSFAQRDPADSLRAEVERLRGDRRYADERAERYNALADEMRERGDRLRVTLAAIVALVNKADAEATGKFGAVPMVRADDIDKAIIAADPVSLADVPEPIERCEYVFEDNGQRCVKPEDHIEGIGGDVEHARRNGGRPI